MRASSFLEKALRRGKGERLGAGEAGIVRELHGQPLVDGVELRVKSGDRGADCVRRSGICLADGGQQALVLALALGDEILALAHQPCQPPRAFGEPHRHLGERIGRARVQGPLRQLKALRARCRAAAARAVHGARCSAQCPCVPRQLHLGKGASLRAVGAGQDRRGAPVQLGRLGPIAQRRAQRGQVIEADRDFGMPRTKAPFIDGERAAIEGLSLGQPVGLLPQPRQASEPDSDAGMVGAKALLIEGERAPIERLGFAEPIGGPQQLG